MSKRIGISVIVLYLAFAFIQWSFNAKEWDINARVGYCLFCAIFAFGLLIYEIVKEEK